MRQGAAEHERRYDQGLLQQAVGGQKCERGAEPEPADQQAYDTQRSGSQEAGPGGNGPDDHAGERDQATRELLYRLGDRDRKAHKAKQQRPNRRQPPAAHRITLQGAADSAMTTASRV